MAHLCPWPQSSAGAGSRRRLRRAPTMLAHPCGLPHAHAPSTCHNPVSSLRAGLHMRCLVQAGSCAPREEEQRGGWQAVDAAESAWSLDDPDGPPGARRRLLLISLAKPPLTETEVTWKKGAPRVCSGGASSLPCHARLLLVTLSGVVDGVRTASLTGFDPTSPLCHNTSYRQSSEDMWLISGQAHVSFCAAPRRQAAGQPRCAAPRRRHAHRRVLLCRRRGRIWPGGPAAGKEKEGLCFFFLCVSCEWSSHRNMEDALLCSLKACPTWEKLGSALLSSVCCEWVGHELQDHALDQEYITCP